MPLEDQKFLMLIKFKATFCNGVQSGVGAPENIPHGLWLRDAGRERYGNYDTFHNKRQVNSYAATQDKMWT